MKCLQNAVRVLLLPPDICYMHPTLLFPTFSKISGRPPLSWSTRVQVALDSARGLEYIHEHTVPVYIHRDIKSANILIDKNYRGKVGTVLVFAFFIMNMNRL